MAPATLAVECSTLTPACARALAEHAQGRGLRFIDAPVAGSRPQAEAGALIHFAGGQEADIDRAVAVLEAISRAVHVMGPVGAGMTMKLVVNALFALQVAAVAELLEFADRSGLEGHRLAAVLAETPTASQVAIGAAKQMLTEDYAPLFPIDLASKDMSYLLSAAGCTGAKTPMAVAVAALLRDASASGLGELQISAVRRLHHRP